MDKPLGKSVTVWGAIIAGVGAIATIVGQNAQAGVAIDWGALVPHVVAVIGGVIAIIGARRAVGNLIAK